MQAKLVVFPVSALHPLAFKQSKAAFSMATMLSSVPAWALQVAVAPPLQEHFSPAAQLEADMEHWALLEVETALAQVFPLQYNPAAQ